MSKRRDQYKLVKDLALEIGELPEALEAMVDAHGLFEVLAALATLCGDKASHVRETWQDNTTARQWDRAYKQMYKACDAVDHRL